MGGKTPFEKGFWDDLKRETRPGYQAGDQERARGADVRAFLDVTLEESVFGAPEKELEVPGTVECKTCKGFGLLPGTRIECEVCDSTGQTEARRKLRVRVPPGCPDRQVLRLRGRGQAGRRGGGAGDLLVTVQVAGTSACGRFTRSGAKGEHLASEVGVPQLGPADQVVGVQGLDGKWGELRVPGGTKPGTVFRVRGKGPPRFGGAAGATTHGDLLVRVVVQTPAMAGDPFYPPRSDSRQTYSSAGSTRSGASSGRSRKTQQRSQKTQTQKNPWSTKAAAQAQTPEGPRYKPPVRDMGGRRRGERPGYGKDAPGGGGKSPYGAGAAGAAGGARAAGGGGGAGGAGGGRARPGAAGGGGTPARKAAAVVLGVPAGAPADEVRQAYRELAAKWHPDKWIGRPEGEKAKAAATFAEVQEAYDELSV